jgi:hypothetical protein
MNAMTFDKPIKLEQLLEDMKCTTSYMIVQSGIEEPGFEGCLTEFTPCYAEIAKIVTGEVVDPTNIQDILTQNMFHDPMSWCIFPYFGDYEAYSDGLRLIKHEDPTWNSSSFDEPPVLIECPCGTIIECEVSY